MDFGTLALASTCEGARACVVFVADRSTGEASTCRVTLRPWSIELGGENDSGESSNPSLQGCSHYGCVFKPYYLPALSWG